jgi:hypothetical protein
MQDEIVKLTENLYKLFDYINFLNRKERTETTAILKEMNRSIEKILKRTNERIAKAIRG